MGKRRPVEAPGTNLADGHDHDHALIRPGERQLENAMNIDIATITANPVDVIATVQNLLRIESVYGHVHVHVHVLVLVCLAGQVIGTLDVSQMTKKEGGCL
jgi:hypothetical protein